MRLKPGPALVLFLLFSGGLCFSQTGSGISGFNSELGNTGQFGFTAGPAIYHGDLNVGHFKMKLSTGLAASIFGQYHFSNVFGFRISLYSGILNGGIKSYEKNGRLIEDSFTGIILEGDLHMIVNFSNLFFRPGPNRRLVVYGTLGLGYAGWYSKLTNKIYIFDSLQYDNPLSNFNASFVLPAGLGFYYRIGNRMNLGLEYTYKTYFSDKLDNSVGGARYDAVHFIALNVSFNLGTGSVKSSRKPAKTKQLQASDYPMPYPVYTQPYTQAYTPPPAVTPTEQPVSRPEAPVQMPIPKASPRSHETFCYSVQVCAFALHRYSAAAIKKRYHIPGEVRIERAGNTERFVTGRCPTLECARELKEKMKQLGIHDAFIVAYKNGKRHHSVK